MQVRAGTSGYAYKEWKGSFYPKDLPNDHMLRFYAERFRTVEINNTFYRMPSERVLGQWAAQVPDDFAFVLKASRRITHERRLKHCDEPMSYLVTTARALGSQLGPMLFQLPPNLKQDVPRLETFLELLPRGWQAAFEFRHASWFDDATCDALRARNAALCVADTDDADPPLVATASLGYLRLRRERYTKAALRRWATWIGDQAWERAFVFFKHEDQGAGPALAQQFLDIAG